MKRLFSILVMLIPIMSCSPKPVIPSQIPAPSIATLPTLTMSPAAPFQTTMPDVTVTPTEESLTAPAAIYSPNSGVREKCVDVSQVVQKDRLGDGVAVLESRRNGSDGQLEPGFYLLDMKTGALTDLNLELKNEKFMWGAVSPDGTLLKVTKIPTDVYIPKLLILDADGKVKKEISLKKGWTSNWAVWQNNQQLKIDISGPETDENGKPRFGNLWLNPFTGEQRIIVPELEFPNINKKGYGLVAYNSTLTRAVYLLNPATFVLWDIPKKKTLLHWVQISAWYSPPHWSPDGSKFLMEVLDPSDTPGDFPNGLYLVDDNGKVSLPAILDYNAETPFTVSDYYWSPSGRYVAFSNGRLRVLDIQTRQITDYCVEYTPSGIYGELPLIWSPDETQILLNDQYSEDHSRVILVDLAKGIAFPIAEDKIATGWMKSP